MISQKLLNPQSIAVVGGSNVIEKTGGRVLKNLLDNHFKGDLFVVNPKEDEVQGIKSYKTVDDLPPVDVAIIAIAAKFCVETIRTLAMQKNTRGFIIFSAGFGEESCEGAAMEKEIVQIIDSVGGSLIGPNCIGMMNANFTGVFTLPIPTFSKDGCDFISGSGATAVFIMEAGIQKGLRFNSVFSVGNSAQLGVEDILKHLDETFNPETDSKVKLLY
ncbi:MAG: CoA-binding protein, partial [Bacteroidales bacterium]|nr:CoA-binding protein [Bacteroidales bacterium]